MEFMVTVQTIRTTQQRFKVEAREDAQSDELMGLIEAHSVNPENEPEVVSHVERVAGFQQVVNEG